MSTTDEKIVTGPCVQGCGRTVTRDMSTAGSFAKHLADKPLWCDECIAAAEADRERAEQEAAATRRADHLPRRIEMAGLPAAHHAKRIRDLDHTNELREAALRWSLGSLPGLVLTGDVGRGKTTLAGAAALEMLHGGRDLIWTSAPLLMARLGSGFDTEQRAWALVALAGRKPLVLDDIDKARPTEYGAEQIFLAVDTRVEHGLPLLVTTNLPLSELAGRWVPPYGEALASRLYGYCQVMNVTGIDRRLGGGAT